MSFPTHELIPAAILFDNPGITREDFEGRLDNISRNMKYAPSGYYDGNIFVDPLEDYEWDLSDLRLEEEPYMEESSPYHTGLHGVADVLGLPCSKKFEERQESFQKQDEFDFWYGVPGFRVEAVYEKGSKSLHFKITTPLEQKLGESTKFGRFYIPGDVKPGGVLVEGYDGGLPFTFSSVEKLVKDWGKDKNGDRIQTVKLREIVGDYLGEEFSGIDELTTAYPHFHPDFMFDWSKERGKLNVWGFGYRDFWWKKHDNLYFLDEEKIFREIPPANKVGTHGDWGTFTDLVITAEAIRWDAWKVFTNAGGIKYRKDFLKAFPKARKRCENAVLDAHLLLPLLQNGEISFPEFWYKSRVLRNMQKHQNLF